MNHIWFVQQLVPRLCFSFFGTSMSKPFSHSDPMFWFCCHWDNNPYLHFGIVRSIQFVQSALASQMKGHLEVKSVLLPLLLTCLKGKPQPDKTLLNKHHPVLERQQSPIHYRNHLPLQTLRTEQTTKIQIPPFVVNKLSKVMKVFFSLARKKVSS